MRALETAAGLEGFARPGAGSDSERRASKWLAVRAHDGGTRGSDRAVLVPPQLAARPSLARRPRARRQSRVRRLRSGRRRDAAGRARVDPRGCAHGCLSRAPADTRASEPERRRDPHRPAEGRPRPHTPDHHRQLRRRTCGLRLQALLPASLRRDTPSRIRAHAGVARLAVADDRRVARVGDPPDRGPSFRGDRRDPAGPDDRGRARPRAAARAGDRGSGPGRGRQRHRSRDRDRARPSARRGGPRATSPSSWSSKAPATPRASVSASTCAPTATSGSPRTRSSSGVAGVHGPARPRWWTSDGPLVPLRYARPLRALCAELAGEEPGLGARPHAGRGAAPAFPARLFRRPAISVGCLAPRASSPTRTGRRRCRAHRASRTRRRRPVRTAARRRDRRVAGDNRRPQAVTPA